MLAISALAWSGQTAMRQGLADWEAMRWRNDVAQWSGKGEAPSAERWVPAADGLRSALRLTPGDPTLHDNLAVLYSLGAWTFQTANGPTRDYAPYAALHFRRAAVLRPTSSYSWAGLASAKYQAGEVDAELFRAMALAGAYGPREPRVQLVLADLGFLLWDAMDAQQQALAVENLHRTAQRQAPALAKLAEGRKRTALLCKNAVENMGKFIKC